MSRSELLVEVDEKAVISRLWTTIDDLSAEAIARNGVFRIGLSGGSLVKFLSSGAGTSNTDWSKWQLFFCDERYVPYADDDSTFGQFKQNFIKHTKLSVEQFVVINLDLDLEQCAKDYQDQIYKAFGITDVSVLCIGLGRLRFGLEYSRFSFTFNCDRKRCRNLICCCLVWVQTVIRAHCFPIIGC